MVISQIAQLDTCCRGWQHGACASLWYLIEFWHLHVFCWCVCEFACTHFSRMPVPLFVLLLFYEKYNIYDSNTCAFRYLRPWKCHGNIYFFREMKMRRKKLECCNIGGNLDGWSTSWLVCFSFFEECLPRKRSHSMAD